MLNVGVDNMTAKYEDLAAKEPIFAELRNCIDLAVVSALILKENLTARAGCELPALLGEKQYAVAQFNVPKQVDSKATAVKKGRNWVITASGGVMIQPGSCPNGKNLRQDRSRPLKIGCRSSPCLVVELKSDGLQPSVVFQSVRCQLDSSAGTSFRGSYEFAVNLLVFWPHNSRGVLPCLLIGSRDHVFCNYSLRNDLAAS